MSESRAIEAASAIAPAPCARSESDFAAEVMLFFRAFSALVKPSEKDDFLGESPRSLLANSVLFRRAWEVAGEIGVRGSGLDVDALERS